MKITCTVEELFTLQRNSEVEALIETNQILRQQNVSLDEHLSNARAEYRVQKENNVSRTTMRGIAEAFQYQNRGEKIAAVKVLREVLGCGLREAKYMIEGVPNDESLQGY